MRPGCHAASASRDRPTPPDPSPFAPSPGSVQEFLGEFCPARIFRHLASLTHLPYGRRVPHRIRTALIAAANLTDRPLEALQSTATVYFSKSGKDDPGIVIDTGCSVSVTCVLSDFVSDITPSGDFGLQGLAHRAKTHGQGTVS